MAEDPRNDDDFDTWEYGTEPLPGDQTWSTNVGHVARSGGVIQVNQVDAGGKQGGSNEPERRCVADATGR